MFNAGSINRLFKWLKSLHYQGKVHFFNCTSNVPCCEYGVVMTAYYLLEINFKLILCFGRQICEHKEVVAGVSL